MDGAIVIVAPDRVSYRASALGGCLGALVAARMEYTAIEKADYAPYVAGHKYEDMVKARMRDEGWQLWDEQLEVVVQLTSKLQVVGHIDAKGMDNLNNYLVELKSQSTDEFDRFDRDGWESGFFPKYKWQVSSYMHATGLPLALIRAERTEAGIGRMRAHVYDEPFYSVADIRKLVLSVEQIAASVERPTCESPSFPCPYFYLHSDTRVELPDPALDELARDCEAARLDAKRAKTEYDQMSVAIRDIMGSESKIVTSTGVKITKWQQKNPPSLDYDALTEAGIDLAVYRKPPSKSWRLKITLPDDETGGSDDG